MHLIKVIKKSRNDFKGVYQCETCHCIHIDAGLDSYDDANYHNNVIPKMQCPFCDDLNLSDQYHMALDTLAWLTCQYRNSSHYPHDRTTFPSSARVYRNDEWDYMSVETNINGMHIVFRHDDITFSMPAGKRLRDALDQPDRTPNLADTVRMFLALFRIDMDDRDNGRHVRNGIAKAKSGDKATYFTPGDPTPHIGTLSAGRGGNKGCKVIRPLDHERDDDRKTTIIIDADGHVPADILNLSIHTKD